MMSVYSTQTTENRRMGKVQRIASSIMIKEARVYLQPEKDREDFWINEHLIEQVKMKAILIFEANFPNCVALFAFDNSSNHAAYKSDAFVASRMNLKPGGKQLKIRNTIFRQNNQYQSMVNENNEPKGMKQMLIKRGL
ncbi:unnamed protein product [Rhizophagus irregularis]|nr:unnamed protein product [Rhizophagus irregularis]